MLRRTLMVGAIALWLWSAPLLQAQEIRYWGKSPGVPRGWIELPPGPSYEVGVGEELPGWGRVKEIGEDHLIVEQALTEAEKERIGSQGMLIYDAVQLHIPREDLRLIPKRSPR